MIDITEIIDAENDKTDRLRYLSDPDFMTVWAVLRGSLFNIPKKAVEYPLIERWYTAAAVEYRRRIDDGFTRPRLPR